MCMGVKLSVITKQHPPTKTTTSIAVHGIATLTSSASSSHLFLLAEGKQKDVHMVDGEERCSVVLEGAGRCSTVLDGDERCSTVLDGAQRCWMVMDSAALHCHRTHRLKPNSLTSHPQKLGWRGFGPNNGNKPQQHNTARRNKAQQGTKKHN